MPKLRNRSPDLLPKSWTRQVRSAMLQVISLAKFAVVYSRGWAADSSNARVRLKVENDQLQQEVVLLGEEIRIKDERMKLIAPHQRPHYSPFQRMAILELKTARGWSLEQAARVFLVTAATLASWLRRVDEEGPNALVQMPEPVNRFPDFTRHVVRRLKTLCPSMGKVKIAQSLARAGLHLAASTVGRILNESSAPPPAETEEPAKKRVVTAKHPNHVWHVDLTVVPTASGFWTTWFPGALPQCWPFCWWVAVVLDHYSRRVMGLAVFRNQPTSIDVRAFLGRSIAQAGATPKYLICDKGAQFWCAGFKAWCQRRSIKPRYGKIGQHGSLALIERFILTLKTEGLRGLVVSLFHGAFRGNLLAFVRWYNGHRPHTALAGATPDEIYHAVPPANQQPRLEPRARWPRNSPCAKPHAPVRGDPGTEFELVIEFETGSVPLPIITLKPAA